MIDVLFDHTAEWANMRPAESSGSGMKIHAYKVEPRGATSLDATLTLLHAIAMEDRLRTVSGTPLRLESIHHHQNEWLLDFTAIRREGPGKAAPDQPIQDFELQDQEGFGQETAGYFDSATNYLILQYNHYGARQSKIQSYLSRFARMVAGQPDNELPSPGNPDQGFNLICVLKAEAADKLEHMGLVKNLDFQFSVPGLAARSDAEKQSLSSLLDTPILGGAAQVRVQVSAGRGKATSLVLNDVKALVADLLGAKDDVGQLIVDAKENEDSPMEPVDFLDARLEADIPIQLGANRRYPRDARLAALKQAYTAWNNNHQLPQ